MTLLQAIILGIVQGATEFIPVSSNAHLVLIPWLLGWPPSGMIFDTVIHWGTLLAVVSFFWQELVSIFKNVIRDLVNRTPLASAESRLGWMLVVATLPAVILGLLFEEIIEGILSEPVWVAASLMVTGLILWVSESIGNRTRPVGALTFTDALMIGLAQAVALVPGISRSGSTIGAGLARGLERPAAARFSFLMMVPIVFGAGLLKLFDAIEVGMSEEGMMMVFAGLIAAAISGYLCVTLLLRYLATQSVRSFAVYCWLFGGLCVLIALFP
ncbi:MAG: undecaprenyl-diphosphatase UppP [Ardenticatenales bacterium]|nr:undecaprenyl-diphosphatase UppP [Ardenticatenales bacterium]